MDRVALNPDEPSIVIRIATESDLREILIWLKEEFEQEGQGFWVNRELIEKSFRENLLWVLAVKDRVVAFATEELGIQETRPDARRRGYGTLLANHCIEIARQQSKPGIVIICCPPTSVPFWETLGFRVVDREADPLQAVKLLPNSRVLGNGTIGQLKIDLLQGYSDVPFGQTFETRVEQIDATYWDLETTFCEYVPSPDTMAKITLNGSQLTYEKVKYCSQFGLTREFPFSFMNRLIVP